MKIPDIQYGIYQHYRTEKLYEVFAVGRDSETHEEMVIYKALYQCEQFGSNQVWVRSKTMFYEQVSHNGISVPRFKWIMDKEI